MAEPSRSVWWATAVGSLTFAATIAIQKAGQDIWYAWILKDPHVVPSLLSISLLSFAIALGRIDRINRIYWRIFELLIPAPEEDEPAPLQSVIVLPSFGGQDSESSSLGLHSATWGNAASRESVLDEILSKKRDGLVFLVGNKDFGGIRNDSAPTDDEKYLQIEYSFRGREARTLKRRRGEWVVIPEESLLMPPKPTRLRLVGIHAGQEPVGREPLAVSVKSESGPTVSNVTVRIRFTSDRGDSFTVPVAHWEVRKQSGTTKYSSCFPGPLSVDVDPMETQSFLLMTKDELGQWWAFGENAVKGLVDPGKWEARLQVCMDGAHDLHAAIGFVVHRDHSIQWGHPAIQEVDTGFRCSD